jgi:hypothetical protein
MGLLIAITPGIPLLGVAVCIPTILTLFVAAYALGTSRNEKLINLIAGCGFTVITILIVATTLDPRPSTWADTNFGWIVVGVAPIAAFSGVAIVHFFRRLHVAIKGSHK